MFALVGSDLATRPSNVGVNVERLPEMVYALVARPRTDIQQYAHVWLEHTPEGIEEPPMRVDFLLVLLLHAEDDLRRDNSLVRVPELEVLVEAESGGVFEQVSRHGLVINHVLHVVAWLVHAEQREAVKYARVDLLASVGDDAHDDLHPVISGYSLAIGWYMMHTFFQASSPHVREFLREHRCAMFRMTPIIVRQNKISSSYEYRHS